MSIPLPGENQWVLDLGQPLLWPDSPPGGRLHSLDGLLPVYHKVGLFLSDKIAKLDKIAKMFRDGLLTKKQFESLRDELIGNDGANTNEPVDSNAETKTAPTGWENNTVRIQT